MDGLASLFVHSTASPSASNFQYKLDFTIEIHNKRASRQQTYNPALYSFSHRLRSAFMALDTNPSRRPPRESRNGSLSLSLAGKFFHAFAR